MKNKNTWICILFILAGLVIGGLIGQLTSGVDFLWWLSYGQEFGLSANSPLVLDLGIANRCPCARSCPPWCGAG